MIVAQFNDIEQQWSQIRSMLRAEVGDPAFSTWLKPLDLASLDGDRVVIGVPTQFMRDWVVAHYADRIRALWSSINPTVRSIVLNVRAAGAAVPFEDRLDLPPAVGVHDRCLLASVDFVLVPQLTEVGNIGEQFEQAVFVERPATADDVLAGRPPFAGPAALVEFFDDG